VAELSPTHVALLNKFNVLDEHLLIVTRAHEDQTGALTRDDFSAAAIALQQRDALAFYNAGRVAGASQPHRHLQVVPLPLGPAGPPILVESAFALAAQFGTSSRLPFLHRFDRLAEPIDGIENPIDAADTCFELYCRALDVVGLDAGAARRGQGDPGAYNLLWTRSWMLLVPRRSEGIDRISINALGFAGALLAKNRQERDRIVEIGPLALLGHAGVREAR
jgi:ATP adenylyltransferase